MAAEKKRETSGERRRRRAAEALEAQRKGDWTPAPAGHSSAAQSEDADRRSVIPDKHAEVNSLRAQAQDRREMVGFARDERRYAATDEEREGWDLLIEDYLRESREIDAEADQAQRELDELYRQRDGTSGTQS